MHSDCASRRWTMQYAYGIQVFTYLYANEGRRLLMFASQSLHERPEYTLHVTERPGERPRYRPLVSSFGLLIAVDYGRAVGKVNERLFMCESITV